MSYFRPADLGDALGWLAEHEASVAAGCTDLFPATDRPALSGPVLDITGLRELRGVTQSDAGWRIGATTTWTDLIRADLPPAFDGLKLAAREVGSVQIQNAGTVAGNICNASPAADGVPCLLILDASVEVTSTVGTRTLPLADFITGPRMTALQPGELLTAIHVPSAAAGGASHFLKLGARKYLVISIAMVAARLMIEDGAVAEAAISVGACSAVAQRLPDAEAAITGLPAEPASLAAITDEMITAPLSPIDDIRADGTYRRTAGAELVRRTLTPLLTPPNGAAA